MTNHVDESGTPLPDVRVLGPVEVAVRGAPVALGGPRQVALLALLATDPGRSIALGRLIDELWSGEPPNGADVTIRSYVSRLRSALGGGVSVVGTSAGYSLTLDADRVDAVRFQRLVTAADADVRERRHRRAVDKLDQALAMWRGRPYGSASGEGMLRAEADRLEELRLRAIELRLEARLALGAAGELVDELEALVRVHPYREALWRQLMLALYRSERQADALDAYHRARAALDDQLGIEPGSELRSLEAAILRHEVPAATAPEGRHNLPAFLTSFIGREREIDEVAAALGAHRLVTLVGVGGVGKTRLAVEVARREVDGTPDGAYFVDLSPISEPQRVAELISTVTGIREQPGQEALERLATQLRETTALIVLDNCEHVRGAAAVVVTRLLQACPGLRILATSREVLGVPGEAHHAVPPLALPAAEDLAAVRSSEAVRLFVTRARAARPDLAEDEAMLQTAGLICAELDGLPLAIELAAARARVLAPAEIAARLRDRFRFLVSWRRLSPARHRTLREAMAWSYDLLDPEAKALLARLSVFAGGFTLEAVAAVCTDGDEDRALAGLERLIDASLVIVDAESDGASRYRVLETVREYAADRLRDDGDPAEARERHAAYFGGFASAVREPLRRSVDRRWLGLVRADRENLRAAMLTSRETGAWDRALVMAEALWWAWWIWGEVRQAREWLEAALEHAGDEPPLLVAQARLGAAGLAWAQGDYDVAERWATQAGQAFADLGEDVLEGSARNTLALVAHARERHDEAIGLLEAALEAYRRPAADPAAAARNIAVAIDNLGSAAYETGDLERAEEQYREALALNHARGDVEGVAMNELHLATAYSTGGDPEAARPLLTRALRTYRDLGFLQYAAECLESASLVAGLSGEHLATARLLGASDAMRGRAGSPPVPYLRRLRERQADLARTILGDSAFDVAFAEGRSMSPDAAMRWTLELLES